MLSASGLPQSSTSRASVRPMAALQATLETSLRARSALPPSMRVLRVPSATLLSRPISRRRRRESSTKKPPSSTRTTASAITVRISTGTRSASAISKITSFSTSPNRATERVRLAYARAAGESRAKPSRGDQWTGP